MPILKGSEGTGRVKLSLHVPQPRGASPSLRPRLPPSSPCGPLTPFYLLSLLPSSQWLPLVPAKSRGLGKTATEAPAGEEGVRTGGAGAGVLMPPLERRAPPCTRPRNSVPKPPLAPPTPRLGPTHPSVRPRPPFGQAPSTPRLGPARWAQSFLALGRRRSRPAPARPDCAHRGAPWGGGSGAFHVWVRASAVRPPRWARVAS